MRIKKQPPGLAEALATYARAKAEFDKAEEELNRAKKALLPALSENGGEATHEGQRFAIVRGRRTSTDWGAILDALDAKTAKIVTTTTIDQRKFEAAMEIGAVDPEIYLSNTTEKEIAPYVKITKEKS